jgi:hypothetical protein
VLNDAGALVVQACREHAREAVLLVMTGDLAPCSCCEVA